MTCKEFRADKQLTALWATELSNNRLLQIVMEAMEEGHPTHHVLNADNNGEISPTMAHIELGVTRGYSMAMDRLRLLARHVPTAEALPESEYADESKEEEK
jgi:hypothetical protein